MNYPLKEILKSLKLLFISKEINSNQREISTFNFFFNKVLIAHNSKLGLKLFSQEHPDVIISDIDIEPLNGIKLCKKIRKLNEKIPIIIFSKLKDEKYLFAAIRIQVIDFIVKPFNNENLIYALNKTAKHIVNYGNINIKLSNNYIYSYKEKTIKTIKNEIISLTKNEYRLLEFFILNKEKTLTKTEITKFLWSKESITESAFKSLFLRLRNKIGKDCIQNIFGVGYKLK